MTHGPLVVLHDHLDGGVRPSTVLDLCHAVGVATPADDAAALGEWMTITPGMELVDAFSRFDLVNAGLQPPTHFAGSRSKGSKTLRPTV